jgi:glycosyltransferase involved in cell wall biosynthesis
MNPHPPPLDERPRILVSAYQCGPGMGSVSQIGWHWYRRLAERTPTTLLTHARNRAAIEAAGGPVADSKILYVDTEWFAGPLYRFASRLFPTSEHAVFLVSSLDFYVYDREALRLARAARVNGDDWALVHAPTPVSPLAATRLYRLGRPLVLGPWNGNLGTPKGFRALLRADSPWLYPIRHLGRIADALIGGTRHAQLILTATEATLAGIPRRYRRRCVRMLENGVEPEIFAPTPWPAPARPATNLEAAEPLRLVFVGRLVPFKAVGLLLAALARLKAQVAVPVRLRIIGDGPMAAPWQAEVDRLGLQAEVRFVGQLSAPAVAAEMAAAHCFCLPSVRESGGAVLLEAMACARPVIAVGFGGPAEIVDDEVGQRLPATHPEALIAALVAALEDLIRDPEAWRRRGLAGHARVLSRYTWDAKVDRALALYRPLLAPVVPPPDAP